MRVLLIIFSFIPLLLCSQQKVGINQQNPQTTLEVNGRIRVGDDTSTSSAGAIRYNNSTATFEGHNGIDWTKFHIDPAELYWPTPGGRGGLGSYFEFSPDDGGSEDFFGNSVDIDGNYSVAGSPGYAGSTGRVFIFKLDNSNNTWFCVDTLTGVIGGEKFGFDVAIHGDRIAIGAPGFQTGAEEYGRVIIYKKVAGVDQWQIEKVKYLDNCSINFGHSLDIHGDIVVASAPKRNCQNAFYKTFVCSFDITDQFPDFFLEDETVSAILPGFGADISFDGNKLAIGRPFSSEGSGVFPKVELYKRNGNTTEFVSIQTLTSANEADQFGISVGINNNKLIIGSRFENNMIADERGRVRIYKENNATQYVLDKSFYGQDTLARYGHAVFAGSNTVLASAFKDFVDWSTEINAYKLFNGRYRKYVTITDPMSTNNDNHINDIAESNGNFIIGAFRGYNINGQTSGRVFFGSIR